jgi:hypothetical protein
MSMNSHDAIGAQGAAGSENGRQTVTLTDDQITVVETASAQRSRLRTRSAEQESADNSNKEVDPNKFMR